MDDFANNYSTLVEFPMMVLPRSTYDSEAFASGSQVLRSSALSSQLGNLGKGGTVGHETQ